MKYAKALSLKPGTLIVRSHKHKNRIWAISVGTIYIANNGTGYFTQLAPYKGIPEPINDWANYKVMGLKGREYFVLWKLENA